MKPAVLMIGGGVQQVDAVRIAKAAGLRVFVSDRDPDAPALRHAEEAWVVDGRDTEELVRRACAARERGLVGVFTLTELVETVAEVARGAGLPGVDPDSARACQDKARAKILWVGAGVATARAGVARDLDGARALFEGLGGDVFLKPATGAGSLGAGPAASSEELEAAFARAFAVDENVLIEERLEGTHHDVNGVFDADGSFHCAGLADRRFAEGLPVEIEASAPTVLDESRRSEALELTRTAALALGIRFGPVKSDLVLTEQGMRILELAPRLHGPKGTLHLLPLAFGFHPLVAALRVATGGVLRDSDLRPRRSRAVLIRAIPPLPGRRLEALAGLSRANAVPGVHGIRILARPGRIMGPMESNADVLGHVFATGSDLDAARESAERAIEAIELVTGPAPTD